MRNRKKLYQNASAKLNEHWKVHESTENNKRIQQMLHIIWWQKITRKMMAKKKQRNNNKVHKNHKQRENRRICCNWWYLLRACHNYKLFNACGIIWCLYIANMCVSFLCVEYIGRKNDNSQHKQPMCSSSAVDNYKIWFLQKNEHQIKIIIKFCPDKRSCS